MALARVQATGKVTGDNATSINLTFPSPPTIGNAIVVLVSCRRITGGNVASAVDNRGHTYVSAVAHLAGTNQTANILFHPKITATGTPFTITVTVPSASDLSASAIEVSGVGVGLGVDRTATGGNTGSTTASTAATAALTVDELFVVGVCALNQAAQASITVSGTWTEEHEELGATVGTGEGVSKVLTGALGTTTSVSWALASSTASASGLVAFKSDVTTDARLSQLPIEVLQTGFPAPDLRLSQLPIEVLRSSAALIPEARLSQLPIEVLLSTAVTLPDPIAYWPFDEATGTTAADASGNGHTATRFSATWDTTALKKFGAAALACPDGGYGASFTPINLGTTYSIAFWMNGWDGANDGLSLGGMAGQGYATYHNSTNIYHQVGSGNYVTAGATGLTGSHHIVVTRTGTSVTFYKDGVSLGATTLGSNTALSLDTISGYAAGTFALAATLDDLRLYDVALSAAEVAALYALVPEEPEPPAGLARVQATAVSHQDVNTQVTITFTTPPTVGNGLIVFANFWGAFAIAPTCSDNQGNTYSLAVFRDNVDSRSTILYCPIVTATGSPFQITVQAPSGSPYWVAQAVEFSGVGSGLTVDQTSSASGTSTAPATGSTAALTGSEVIQAACHAIAAAQASITVVSATPVWTQEFEELPYNQIAGEGDTRVVSSAAGTTPSCSWTDTGSGAWAAVLAAFKAGAAAPALNDARVSQLAVETLTSLTSVSTGARLSQLVVETLTYIPPPTAIRTSQLIVETLSNAAAPARLSQLIVETLTEIPHVPARVTHAVTELLNTMPKAPLRATHVVAELLSDDQFNETRVTMAVCELIIIPGPPRESCPEAGWPVDLVDPGGACPTGPVEENED